MGMGALTGWLGYIRPFFDRPDIRIQVVWYGVPDNAPAGPLTVFTDRFYDQLDGWVNLGVGTEVGSLTPYFGAVPAPGILPQIGTAADFVTGLSYADYLAGAVGDRCFVVDPPTQAVRMRQIEYITLWPAVAPVRDRGGVLVGGSDAPRVLVIRHDQGGVLVGGSDAPLPAPVLSDQGGVLVGGSDAPLPGFTCGNCPGGYSAREYTIAVVGALANGCSDCTPTLGTFTLAYDGPCSYKSGTVTLCGVDYNWFLSIGVGVASLVFERSPSGPDQALFENSGSWDCVTPTTLTLVTDFTSVCDWTLVSITLTGV
jgi:hypothetical protein